MDSLTEVMRDAMERAAISGLCRDGQLELAVQEARKHKPDIEQNEAYALAVSVYEQTAG